MGGVNSIVTSDPSSTLLKSYGVEVKLPPEQGLTETVWKQPQVPVKCLSEVTVTVIELCYHVYDPSVILITVHPDGGVKVRVT